MKFTCKEISIDDEEMGCTVCLAEKNDDDDPSKLLKSKISIDEVLESIGQYILLQRTYAEDDSEEDYVFLETNNEEISGRLINYSIDLSEKQFLMKFENNVFEIDINITGKKFNKLKMALAKIVGEIGKLTVHG